MRVNEIQQQVGRGDYQVDNNAVAEAILRRLMQAYGHRDVTPPAGRSE